MFHACYLLTPRKPAAGRSLHMTHTYIGFTMTPKRRLRQHNGELVQGAKKTSKHRPWDMLVVVYGFPNKVLALQFEYVWQHPYNSRFTKAAMQHIKGNKRIGGMRSVRRKLVELYMVLNLPPWRDLKLTVSFTTGDVHDLAKSVVPTELPVTMQTQIASLDALPQGTRYDETACSICLAPFDAGQSMLRCYHADCPLRSHVACIDECFPEDSRHLPTRVGYCPYCDNELRWTELVARSGNESSPAKKPQRRPEACLEQAQPPRVRSASDDEAPFLDLSFDDVVIHDLTRDAACDRVVDLTSE
ncbi:hypothetical protein ACHHYP_20452 [Achlya hypogyna]|uniref:Structure-specific endonuclease subunit SLX1 homolog n=1 Tax=Achlya hypogyna TaxID=1202772 RepID=A0A1V9ZIL7_ACHHY|nr:hypothetical protein ACHHYP_20452 [Achlya hypogyna]